MNTIKVEIEAIIRTIEAPTIPNANLYKKLAKVMNADNKAILTFIFSLAINVTSNQTLLLDLT